MRDFSNELRGLLQRGFYADNFAHLERVAREAAMSIGRPLPFALLWLMFLMLDREWRERPLRDEVARRMEQHLIPPIQSYLIAADSGLSPEAEAEHLNEISGQFLAWLEIQKDFPWS
jgi:hypothetical protein